MSLLIIHAPTTSPTPFLDALPVQDTIWEINNKYYTARVNVLVHPLEAPWQGESEAVIYLYDSVSPVFLASSGVSHLDILGPNPARAATRHHPPHGTRTPVRYSSPLLFVRLGWTRFRSGGRCLGCPRDRIRRSRAFVYARGDGTRNRGAGFTTDDPLAGNDAETSTTEAFREP